MPGLNDIAKLINKSIKSGHFKSRRFNPTRFLTIADPFRSVENDDKEVTIPSIIDDEGEGIQIVFDDKFSAQCYHRITNLSYALPDPQYGSPKKDIQESADMKLIFMGDRIKMGVRQEDVVAAVSFDFPKEFMPSDYQPLGLTSCIIEMGSVENNPYDVFISEWNGRDYDLATSSILFALNYRIISTYSKCFEICKQ